MDRETGKRAAAEAAIMLVEPGMTLGLGTGSTARYAIEQLGRRVREGLDVRAVPTSRDTARLAREAGIPLVDFAEVAELDLAMDGADEIDPALNLTKGGGGALFREKIVASAARRFVVFADGSKLVPRLGAFPLPVEVNPFGWQVAARRIAALGAEVSLRTGVEGPFVTDSHGYILDCRFGAIAEPARLDARLHAVVGVMETGLFVGMTELVLLGEGDRVREVHAGDTGGTVPS